MYVHKRNLKNSRYQQTGLYRQLRALLESGKSFEPRKVFDTDDEQSALLEESRRIELYGFDNLFNSTTVSGLTASSVGEMARQAMSKARRKYVAKLKSETGQSSLPETRAKIRAALVGRVVTHEHAVRVSAAKSGVSFTESHKKALSIAAKSRGYSQTTIDAMRRANIGKHKDTTAARLARKRRHYALVSPIGKTYEVQSNGIVNFLKSVNLPTTTFYRACAGVICNGWTVKFH